jgi:Kef-type K+ transport system membrane component KefB
MRKLLWYLVITGSAIGVFLVVRGLGAVSADAVASAPQPAAVAPPANHLIHLLLALVVIIVLARLLGLAFRRIAQPPVVGEIVAGILLGPSFLGRFAPEASAFLLPTSIVPLLRTLADIGVIVYMFLVGIDFDLAHLRKRTHTAIAVSHTSIVAPFVMGTMLALWLYPHWAPASVGFGIFAAFIGVSMSVTAFPVLARILTDRAMHTSLLGTTALACAAVDDATAWCLLALLIGFVHAEPGAVVFTFLLVVGFVAFVFLIVRPLALRLARRCELQPELGQGAFAIVCIAVLLAAVATEAIGIHALFGAFLVGTVIPRDSRLAREIRVKLSDVVLVLLLPAFFAFTGLRMQLGLLDSWYQWLACSVIVAVAACGKFGGSAIAARITGLDWRHSVALGALMNTRGLMELIVLNIGLDLGIISPVLFTMFVIMAILTTASAGPVLDRLKVRDDARKLEPHDA